VPAAGEQPAGGNRSRSCRRWAHGRRRLDAIPHARAGRSRSPSTSTYATAAQRLPHSAQRRRQCSACRARVPAGGRVRGLIRTGRASSNHGRSLRPGRGDHTAGLAADVPKRRAPTSFLPEWPPVTQRRRSLRRRRRRIRPEKEGEDNEDAEVWFDRVCAGTVDRSHGGGGGGEHSPRCAPVTVGERRRVHRLGEHTCTPVAVTGSSTEPDTPAGAHGSALPGGGRALTDCPGSSRAVCSLPG